MTEETLRTIYDLSADRIRETEMTFHRSLYSAIDWSTRVLALSGPRGVGKTTMLLQHLHELNEGDKALYVSMDNLWLNPLELYDLAKYHVQHGGTLLYIDEIHYLKDWQKLVKNLYDNFNGLHIAYTGSSILRLEAGKGDLSRRQLEYSLPGLSFREYLELEGLGAFKAVSLEELLEAHVSIASSVLSKFHVLPHFERYLRLGYYPFFREDAAHFPMRLKQVMNQVLDVDLPLVEDVTPETVRKARRMLTILAASTPQTPNLSQLCRNLEMDRKQGYKVLHALRRAGLLGLLAEDAEALKHLGAPNKIYCDNTNLMYALTADVDKGTLREAFFNNQLSVVTQPTFPKKGDFLIDDRWSFEVGGAGKSFDQIKDDPNGYLAVDDTEVGRGHRIPLWLFGFLY